MESTSMPSGLVVYSTVRSPIVVEAEPLPSWAETNVTPICKIMQTASTSAKSDLENLFFDFMF